MRVNESPASLCSSGLRLLRCYRFDFLPLFLDCPREVFLAVFFVAAAFFTPRLGAFLGVLVTLRAPFLTEAGTRFATAFLARLAADLTAVCANAPAARAAKSVI